MTDCLSAIIDKQQVKSRRGVSIVVNQDSFAHSMVPKSVITWYI